MKFLVLSLLFFLMVPCVFYGQGEKKGDSKEKIEALEKIKLLETLDMDEETALKFFSRRNDYKEKMKGFLKELDAHLEKIESKISSAKDDNDPELKNLVDGYFIIHQRMNEERKKFFSSLTGILTNKQLAQLTLFERRFKEEIRDVLMHKNKKHRD